MSKHRGFFVFYSPLMAGTRLAVQQAAPPRLPSVHAVTSFLLRLLAQGLEL